MSGLRIRAIQYAALGRGVDTVVGIAADLQFDREVTLAPKCCTHGKDSATILNPYGALIKIGRICAIRREELRIDFTRGFFPISAFLLGAIPFVILSMEGIQAIHCLVLLAIE